MLCIHSLNTDPYYNLAAEEHFLKTSEEEYFMLWQSVPAVVIGKHQNALAEINYRFTKDKGILLARRLTGGGTVYHDGGNLNFTFIRNGEPGKLVDFASFIDPVIRFLDSLNIKAIQGPKHEILAGGIKISGNAEHVYKNRVLHHGTLLFNADMNMLRQSISHQGCGIYSDRAVQSNRSSVINLSELMPDGVTISEFKKLFIDHMLSFFSAREYVPDESEQVAVKSLAEEKYRTWEWIFGWSPDYSFKNSWKHSSYEAVIELSIHRGLIKTGKIDSLQFAENTLEKIKSLLMGLPHREEDIRKVLNSAGFNKELADEAVFEDLVMAFF